VSSRARLALVTLASVAACAVVPFAASITTAGDSAEVYGVDTARKPIDLVYGVHGFFKVRGTVDEARTGGQGLAILVHPIDNESGQKRCPSPAPKPTDQFDSYLAVGSPFDLTYTSGIWNLGHHVRFCFYFEHRDGSETDSFEDVTFRDPIDKVTLKAPNLPVGKAGARRMLTITLGGESDHQYSGLIRVHAAARACQATYGADTGLAGGIPYPGGVRYWNRLYASAKVKGPTLNVGSLGRGTYRVCAWLGPARKPVYKTSTTFRIG
jgi:hypothetical protein